MEYFFSYLHFFSALVYVTLAVIILIKDFRSPFNIACAAIFACMFIWSFSFVWIHHPATSKPTVELFEDISSIGWIWFTYFHFWFAWLYARRKPFKFFYLIVVIVSVVPIVLLFQQWQYHSLVDVHLPTNFGWTHHWNKTGWLYLYFAYYLIVTCIGLGIINDCRNRSKNPTIKKQSTILIVVGVLSLSIGSAINVILPFFFTNPMAQIADVTTLIWAVGLAYVAIKYRMLDITPFITAKEIITVMRDMLFLLDVEGHIVSVNPSTLKMLEYTNDELVGKLFNDFIIENDLISEKSVNKQSKTIVIDETFLRCRSGKQIPVALSAELLAGIGIVCVASDITLQKNRTETLRGAKKYLESEVYRATEELQETNTKLLHEVTEKKQVVLALTESEERFRAIFEHAPNGIFLADLEGNVVDVNQEILRIFGYKKDELKGKNLFDFGIFTPDDQGIFATVLTKNISGNESTSKELGVKRKDGVILEVEIMSHPVSIEKRDLVLGVVLDLTLRKKAEEETEKLKSELHHAQKLDAIGRLAGGISHDFNNLLTGIMGYAGILQKRISSQSEKDRDILGKIIALTKQASTLTTQLLAFARKGKYCVEDLNVHEIIDDVVELLEHIIDRQVQLKKVFNTSKPYISGDRSQIHSALLNLGINAKDALTDGGTILFTTEVVHEISTMQQNSLPLSNSKSFLKITVSDDGIGMNTNTKSRIFEPFFTTKPNSKGTGLGLPSVYGTVKQHNGLIDVSSNPGQGSTFTIYLPLLMSEIDHENKPVTIANKVPVGMILVVDDIELVCNMTEEVLHDSGFEVETCHSGEEALKWYQEHYKKCDLVLLDMTLPKLNGAECFKIMKKINPMIKVILTSGHIENDEINSICSEGVTTFLPKPFEADTLVAAITKILARTH